MMAAEEAVPLLLLAAAVVQAVMVVRLVCGGRGRHGAPRAKFAAHGAQRRSRGRRVWAEAQQYEDKDMAEVQEYFNGEGFNRWNKIYNTTDDVNDVQLDIRTGHGQTIAKVLKWVDDDANAPSLTVCDVGCGVGELAIPLASRGATVFASDISSSMVAEASSRASQILPADQLAKTDFQTVDLESVTGKFDTVTCIDVMIHYPTNRMTEMVQSLTQLADRRVIISFAPNTWYYTILKKIGELFPGPSKTTRAYLHQEEAVMAALKANGFTIKRREFTGTSFYFSRMFEAVRD